MKPTLIPALLSIQERRGYLPEAELQLLALTAEVPLYRLEELTTFFPHFRREPPPDVSVHVCDSMTCHLRGSADLLLRAAELAKKEGPRRLEVRSVSCLGRCDHAPVALVSRHHGAHFHDHLCVRLGAEPGREIEPLVRAVLDGGAVPPRYDGPADVPPEPSWQIDPYRQPGAQRYAAVRRFLDDEADAKKPAGEKLTADGLLARLIDAFLFGMGGAAAGTGNKWKDVRRNAGQRKVGAFVVCNGDESEPGTFKDREILLHAPHLVVEGMLLAGLVLRSADPGEVAGYVYIRHEYPAQIEAVRGAIAEARRLAPEALERCPLEVYVSPGAYICGEESALIEAIEGKRAQPREKQPTIRTNGLGDRPTLLNNVETFAWVPAITLGPPGWWKEAPHRFFSISGDVKSPGVFEVPLTGTTLGGLIERAGGLVGGTLQAVAPSGPSAGFLPATLRLPRPLREVLSDAMVQAIGTRSPFATAWVRSFRDRLGDADRIDVRDLLLDKQLFKALGLDLGGGIVVYGSGADMGRQALNCLRFFEKESCGKCVPCRLGCQQLARLLVERPADLAEAAGELAATMQATSICGLGQSASNPLTSYLEHFAAPPRGQP